MRLVAHKIADDLQDLAVLSEELWSMRRYEKIRFEESIRCFSQVLQKMSVAANEKSDTKKIKFHNLLQDSSKIEPVKE